MIMQTRKDGENTILVCRTKGVCAHTIQVVINQDNKIEDVVFIGGCQGNARAVTRLIKGVEIEDVINKLDGVMCSDKGTSCTDQLAQNLKEYLNK